MSELTISIVLYKSNREKLRQAIDSVRKSQLDLTLYLIDNSPTDELKDLAGPRIKYIFNGANLGFGKAHNLVMRKAVDEAPYHLVLNPDVYFDENVLEALYQKMENSPDVGMISPRILYPDGATQYLCKLLPTPLDLFGRRFLGGTSWAERRNEHYELRASGYDKPMNIPYLSGCFMFLRTSVLREVGFFDERIFMYIEDADLTRRIHQRYQTLFFPEVVIYHHYAKGSYNNKKLMLYNIHGASIYFFKYGWILDRERDRINQEVVTKYLNISQHI